MRPENVWRTMTFRDEFLDGSLKNILEITWKPMAEAPGGSGLKEKIAEIFIYGKISGVRNTEV